MVALAALCVFAAISALAFHLQGQHAPSTERRLATLAGERGRRQSASLEEAGPSRQQALATMLRQLLPSKLLARMAVFLSAANVRAAPEMVLGAWICGALVLPVLYLLTVASSGLGPLQLGSAGALLALGGYAPLIIIRGRIKKRRAGMLKQLPDLMDLLTTCVESGLGIDAAIAKGAEKAKEPLAEEFRMMMRMMAMGRPRREALEQFADRSGLPEIVSFTGAIIQAERMGVSLGQVLRVQSDAMRVQRKQRAQQKAFKAPVKIIVVLALFIFPSMFVVIIGPAALPFIH